ncbi:hypothetical protein DFH09DRAFT_1351896 [Mycena vulgaris]|nr:hypothetical protein DFH09DRAFT_1351896 [Mycena vulgaris]
MNVHDELVLRSIVIHDSRHAEQYSTHLTASGDLRIERSDRPPYHFCNPHFQELHQAAMRTAIRERALELGIPYTEVEQTISWKVQPGTDKFNVPTCGRPGLGDLKPSLLPGTACHEGPASAGPDRDDGEGMPGFQAQVLAQRIEHLSNMCRPRSLPVSAEPGTIGLMDQPSRSSKTIACLSALIKVGSSSAYALFNSGSNTDLVTPEYANAISDVRIPLTEQINFGTRVPIDFGGVKGHLYFDQVNLDRYDTVIGTPFMNRHGVVLDFGKREIRFPNVEDAVDESVLHDQLLVLPSEYLYVIETESDYIVALRQKHQCATVEEVIDEESLLDPLPTLPIDYPYVYEPESEYRGTPPPVEGLGFTNVNYSNDDWVSYSDIPHAVKAAPSSTAIEGGCLTTVTFGLFDRPHDGFLENSKHRFAMVMPGLFDTDRVAALSSAGCVSVVGDEDPHGLCKEALAEAIRLILLRSMCIMEEPIKDDDVPQRLHALRAKWF